MATGDDEARWVPNKAAHHIRTLVMLDQFYRQVSEVGSWIERARALVAAGPSIGIVYVIEDLTHAWAILQAHLEFAESVLGIDHDEPADELRTSPAMQRIHRDSCHLLARCTALANEWGAAPILLIRLRHLGVRLLVTESVPDERPHARRRVIARCGRHAAARPRVAWVMGRGRGKS
jgi:hypothetical protein